MFYKIKEKLRLFFDSSLEDEVEPSAIICIQFSDNMAFKQLKYGQFYSLLLIIFGNHYKLKMNKT